MLRRMRTTITIDADVLSAARDLAEHDGTTIGHVISDLARQSLTRAEGQPDPAETFFGFAPLPQRGGVVSNDLIDSIRNDEGI